jgi:hypothetical protein
MTTAKGRAFISGAYSGSVKEIEENITRARVVIAEVLKAGYVPVCPNVFWSPFADIQDYDFWLEAALSLLETCDLLVLVPGWETSSGVKREVRRARELGIPIVNSDLEPMAFGSQVPRVRKPLTMAQLRSLEKVITTFTDEHRISGSECVSQQDDVIVGGYKLIENLAEIVGYYQYPDDED